MDSKALRCASLSERAISAGVVMLSPLLRVWRGPIVPASEALVRFGCSQCGPPDRQSHHPLFETRAAHFANLGPTERVRRPAPFVQATHGMVLAAVHSRRGRQQSRYGPGCAVRRLRWPICNHIRSHSLTRPGLTPHRPSLYQATLPRSPARRALVEPREWLEQLPAKGQNVPRQVRRAFLHSTSLGMGSQP